MTKIKLKKENNKKYSFNMHFCIKKKKLLICWQDKIEVRNVHEKKLQYNTDSYKYSTHHSADQRQSKRF